jgi:prophage antirepressor-like protein
MSSLTPFCFESSPIRVLSVDGLPWFVAKDVAEALEYGRFDSNLLLHVPEEWKGTNPIRTPGGEQELWCLSEPGLYFFVNRSDKPKALPFQKWVAGEVLPAIRQTGGYRAQPQPETITLTKDEYLAIQEERIELLKIKIDWLDGQPRRRMMSDEERAEIVRLHSEGYSKVAIAQQVNRPVGSVGSCLRQARLEV